MLSSNRAVSINKKPNLSGFVHRFIVLFSFRPHSRNPRDGAPASHNRHNLPEFDSHFMRTLCERLGIEVATAPGEAHWTMGVIERQHETLRIGLSKHMAEGISLEESLALTTT